MMRQPTALGVYIYAGGFTLGVKRAGFQVLAQLEDGPFGVATTRANHPGLPVYDDAAGWPRLIDEMKDAGQPIDFVYCNPPCAPFSNAGISSQKAGHFKEWWKQDPRVNCVRNAFDVFKQARPRVWAWESVQGAFTRGRELVDQLTLQALDLGYSASYVLLDAVHLGVPQRRRRFFCVFHDVKIDWQYPRLEQRDWRTVGDAWRYLRDPEPGLHRCTAQDLDLMKDMGQGESPRQVWEDRKRVKEPNENDWERNKQGHVKGRPGFNARRLRLDQPCNTMLGGPHLIHPTEDRFISVKEAQVLCGYPADYVFKAKNADNCFTEMARAVMPPVGQWLAANICDAINRGEEQRDKIFLVHLQKGFTEELPAPV